MNNLCKKRSWEYIQERHLSGCTIILDIDGVLMAQGETTIPNEILQHVAKLKENNDIHIVTNSFIKERCTYVRDALGVAWVDSPYKKPSTRILSYMKYDATKPLVMIGDKILTDGIFAKRIGAEAIMMERRVQKNDPLFIKFTYSVDDIAYWLLIRLWCTR